MASSRFICDIIAHDRAKAMVEQGKYSLIIAGHAGPLPPKDSPCPWRRFSLTSLEDFVGPVINSPPELLELMVDAYKTAEKINATGK